MIVVTGASGKLGGGVINHLLNLVPASQIIATTRDVSTLSHLAEKGVTVRAVDFLDTSTLGPAFEGATKILIVSPPSMGQAAIDAGRNSAGAAAKSGAARIYYTSHVGAREKAAFGPGVTHFQMEQKLKATGIPFTSLRNGFYASSLPFMIGGVSKTHSIVVPMDGKASYVGHDDLARATAKLLAAPVEEEQPEIVNLTGAKAYSMRDIADFMSKKGEKVDYKQISEEEYVDSKVQGGMPEHLVRSMALGFYQSLADGDFELVTDDIEKITGQKAKSLEELLASGEVTVE